jgi:hypothetical protein
MTEAYNNLLKKFDQAIQKKEANKFSKGDVKEIYAVASVLFDGSVYLEQAQLEQIRDKWVVLAAGKLDKGNAMKKLQGTSRAEAIQSVLLSTL